MATLNDTLAFKGLKLRNRLVLPPITTAYGTPEGEVTDRTLGFYRQRARQVGMVIVEAVVVSPDARLIPRSMGLWSDGQIAGMARLAKAIKAEGAVAAVQIAHAGARGPASDTGISRGSPSGAVMAPGEPPTILSEGQIAGIVEDFARAVARAREAGFDAAEIHGGHHYLISQFLSPIINGREDRYGGDVAGRATLALEVTRAVRARVGEDYPVLFRFNAVELMEGGQTIEEGMALARLLEAAGVDALHASLIAQGGWRESSSGVRFLQSTSALLKEQPFGGAVPYAAKIKESVGIPVIAVGKLADVQEAAEGCGAGVGGPGSYRPPDDRRPRDGRQGAGWTEG